MTSIQDQRGSHNGLILSRCIIYIFIDYFISLFLLYIFINNYIVTKLYVHEIHQCVNVLFIIVFY